MRAGHVGLFAIGAGQAGLALGQAPPAGERHADIVVTGKRVGDTDLLPELELDAPQIEDYGADDISDFLERIAPLIDGSGDRPAVLVNGKRITDPREINRYPAEALERAQILPPEAAARYGFAPDKRVVNLVLKRQFAGITAQPGLSLPTAGGQNRETLNLQRFVVNGDSRWNINLTAQRQSRLLQSSRSVSPLAGAGSTLGTVRAPGGGELDPGLSALAGQSVDRAAVPASAGATAPALADFLPGAGKSAAPDDAPWRTLSPASWSADLSAGLARPVGAANLSLNLQAAVQQSRSWLGLSPVSLLLPAGSPFSPFSQDVQLDRLVRSAGPLTTDQRSTSFGVTAGLSFKLGTIMGNTGLAFDRSESTSRTMRRLDFADAAQRVATGDPTLNPFADLPAGPPDLDHSRTRTDSISANMFLSNQFKLLPAGQANWTLSASYGRSRGSTRFADGEGTHETRRSESHGNANLALALPIASRQAKVLPWLGELTVTAITGLSFGQGASARLRYGANLAWSPLERLSLHGRYSIEENGPTDEQRSAPRLETPNVRIYDLVRGEQAEIVQVSGGNPDLTAGSNRSLGAGASLRIGNKQPVMIGFNYQHRESRGGVSGLPGLTPQVEAAFPERFVRDALGRLIQVDNRPINLEREVAESLNSHFSWSIPLGPAVAVQSAAPVPQGSNRPPMAGGFRGVRGDPRGGRIELAFNHGWQLRNALMIRQGLPLLDRLRGEGGGQSRHTLGAQLLVARNGLSATLNLSWQGAWRTRLSGAGPGPGDLRYAPLARARLSLDANLARIALFRAARWAQGIRLSLDVDNLFNSRQSVTRADGTVPPGYGRDDVDPVGRMVSISLRRRF